MLQFQEWQTAIVGLSVQVYHDLLMQGVQCYAPHDQQLCSFDIIHGYNVLKLFFTTVSNRANSQCMFVHDKKNFSKKYAYFYTVILCNYANLEYLRFKASVTVLLEIWNVTSSDENSNL